MWCGGGRCGGCTSKVQALLHHQCGDKVFWLWGHQHPEGTSWWLIPKPVTHETGHRHTQLIGSLPLSCKEESQALTRCISFWPTHSIHREKQGEFLALGKALGEILLLLLLLLFSQDLCRVLTAVHDCICVHDSGIKDGHITMLPKATGSNISTVCVCVCVCVCVNHEQLMCDFPILHWHSC